MMLRRLMWFLLGVLLVTGAMLPFAKAANAITPGWYVSGCNPGNLCGGAPYNTAFTGYQAACDAIYSYLVTQGGSGGTGASVTTGPYSYACYSGTGYNTGSTHYMCADGTQANANGGAGCVQPGQCGAGNWNGTQCTAAACGSGYHYDDTLQKCAANCGDMPSSGLYTVPASNYNGGTLCIGGGTNVAGCSYQPLTASNQYKDSQTGQQLVYGAFVKVTPGETCNSGTGAVPANPQQPPTPCPAGKVPGIVNGQSVCVTASSTSPATGVQTSSNTTQNKDAQGNVTGTTTKAETTSTTCNGTTCATTTTTTTTTKDAAGNVTGTSTDTKTSTTPVSDKTKDDNPVSNFCKDNPTSPLCKVSAIVASCGQFSCDGDAVQCATAKVLWDSKCTWETADKAGWDAAQSANEANGLPKIQGTTSQEVQVDALLNTTSRLSESCPGPDSFSFYGHSFSVSYDPFCTLAGYVRIFVILASCFFAVRLIAGGL